MRVHVAAPAFLCIVGTLLPAASIQAQAVRTIQVTGSGTVSESPNTVTVRGTLAAGGDSIEKTAEMFAETKDKFTKAFDLAEHPGVTVEFAGEKLTQVGGWADAGAAFAVPGDFDVPIEEPAAVGGYSMSEEVVLRISLGGDMEREGIAKKLGSVVKAATKAGLTLGGAANPMMAAMGMATSTSVTQFELDEIKSKALRAKAYVSAMKDARSRAAVLAELSGGRLGNVVSIEEAAAPEQAGDLESLQMSMLRQMFGVAAGGASDGIDHNGRIELQQDLVVTFELVD